MRRLLIRLFVFSFLILLSLLMTSVSSVRADVPAQQPTVDIPTVTGTPIGPVATVNQDQEQINVRSGPGTEHDAVGVLVAGEQVPALGRSAGGSWIQIAYPAVESGVAWVYAPLVTLSQVGELPIVEPPPTPTPRVTPTIDPTLASQFVVEVAPTRLPTFTPPPPVSIPTYEPPAPNPISESVPMGLVISLFSVIGMFGALVSFLRGR